MDFRSQARAVVLTDLAFRSKPLQDGVSGVQVRSRSSMPGLHRACRPFLMKPPSAKENLFGIMENALPRSSGSSADTWSAKSCLGAY